MTQRSSLFPWLPSPLALKCCPRCPRSLSSSHAPTSSSGEYRHSHTRKESRRTPTTTVPLPTDIVTFRTASLYCRKQTLKVHFFRLHVCHQSCHQLGMGVADADSGPFQFTESRTGRRGSSELLASFPGSSAPEREIELVHAESTIRVLESLGTRLPSCCDFRFWAQFIRKSVKYRVM